MTSKSDQAFGQIGSRTFPTKDFEIPAWHGPSTNQAENLFEEQNVQPLRRNVNHEGIATLEENPQTGSRTRSGEYSQMVFDTSPCGTPASSVSGDDSMCNHVENSTPPESPSVTTAAGLGRLSLEAELPVQRSESLQDVVASHPAPKTNGKRAASSELPRQKKPTLATQIPRTSASFSRGRSQTAKRNVSRKYSRDGHPYGQPFHPNANEAGGSRALGLGKRQPFPRDSGYESAPSRQSTLPQLPPAHAVSLLDAQQTQALAAVEEHPWSEAHSIQPSRQDRYPGLILEPESSPISRDQLAAEVKGIYAGLVMVEAKCINIDAAQAKDPTSQLGPEQWQALIALHRTLLYEHHDFLMATQHPSATPALRGLASKYSMPARMWRHGIHAFLEILRHRRPESQDYMMAFIYLAYQMMALLFETVPTFTDTWIECLGDLARYRMAIEEEREAHSIWGGVAGRWYSIASDRHPAIGRLYHHLGILERPSLRKFFLYAKSLTCVVPFQNARDSLATLCTPIVEEHGMDKTNVPSAEASLVTYHALVFSSADMMTTCKIASDALSRLSRQSTARIRYIGVELVLSNVAALLELGSSQNRLWALFAKAINDNIQKSRPSANTPGPPIPDGGDTQDQLLPLASTKPPSFVMDFSYSAFSTLIRFGRDRQSVRDTLPSVHAILVWMHALFTLRSMTNDDLDLDTYGSLMNPDTFSWGGLSDYLNFVTQLEPIGARTMEFARQGMFPIPERSEEARPLSEDYLIRGLIWSQFYYPVDWFSGPFDDDSREIETSGTYKARTERVHWLGLYLAFRIDNLKFDMKTRSFFAPLIGPSQPLKIGKSDVDMHQVPATDQCRSSRRSSTDPSIHSDSEGYAVIPSAKSKPLRTWANVASKPAKARPDYSAVKVVDDEYMQWEQ